MPRIIVFVREIHQKANFVAHVRHATWLPASTIVLSLNGKMPLGEWDLFGNDHERIAQCLRDLLAFEKDGAAVFSFYELQDSDNFERDIPEKMKISSETLRNILDERDVNRRKLNDRR